MKLFLLASLFFLPGCFTWHLHEKWKSADHPIWSAKDAGIAKDGSLYIHVEYKNGTPFTKRLLCAPKFLDESNADSRDLALVEDHDEKGSFPVSVTPVPVVMSLGKEAVPVDSLRLIVVDGQLLVLNPDGHRVELKHPRLPGLPQAVAWPLTPVAVAADIVTLPVQLLAFFVSEIGFHLFHQHDPAQESREPGK